jgi:hypothetical protein
VHEASREEQLAVQRGEDGSVPTQARSVICDVAPPRDASSAAMRSAG